MAENLYDYASNSAYSSGNQSSVKSIVDGKESVVITMLKTAAIVPIIGDNMPKLLVGETYRASLWIKSSAVRTWSDNAFYINGITYSRIPSNTVLAQVTTEWRQIETFFKYKVGSSNIHLYPQMQAGDVLTVGDVRVEAYKQTNYVRNPNVAGSGSVAGTFSTYSSGTTIAGTRSVSNNVQTLTVTSLVGGNRRFGISIGNILLTTPPVAGDRIYFSAEVDMTGLDPGTQLQLYADLLVGSSYLGVVSSIATDTSIVKIEGYQTVTTNIFTQAQSFIWIKATADWTGTSTIKFSKVMLSVIPASLTASPYFDGSTPPNAQYTHSWTGTPDDSTTEATPGRTVKVLSGGTWTENPVKRLREGSWVAIKR